MANTCMNYVAFLGETSDLNYLLTFLTDIIDNKDGVFQHENEGFYNAYINEEESWNRVLTVESSWTTPLELFKHLAQKFEISFTLDYEELGSYVYGQIWYNYKGNYLFRFALSSEVVQSILEIDENEDGLYHYNGELYESYNFILEEMLEQKIKALDYERI